MSVDSPLHVDADDSFARDWIAHVLAGACGAAALPALLRARVSDRNDDGDTLEFDVLDLFSAWPEASLRLVLGCVASDDPGTRLVGIWGLTSWCVIAGGHALLVRGMVDRSVLTHPLFTGVS
ncbi:hypothetical protein ACFVTC_42140, partial [Streptomyces sp. NPDC057950]|uniref:hypothetical protein n=1 Tax=Streptomyces sp. NPDC057950 TaxID=3346288 RepID=UPI0036E60F87